ncbi:unnamed protein product [Owenia fusiformis]|uniref:Protein sidekick n=1 Tax=Owenia fusiformis TaxID=6347 RepID=A0A8S4PPY7_OWEFU|nr:unnamed protein product [Owenia fusiformis]
MDNLPRLYSMLLVLCLSLSALHSSQAQVTEGAPPRSIEYPLGGDTTHVGNRHFLLCISDGSAFPAPVYRWKKDNVFITENSTDRTLKLENIQRNDAGLYQCLAANQFGAVLSRTSKVGVTYIFPFSNPGAGSEISVDQGQAAVIEMPPIDCFPEPWVEWFDQNILVQNSLESHRYHVTLNHKLVILGTDLDKDNGKLFKVTATNKFTSGSDSKTFTLRVQNVGSLVSRIPPQIIIPPVDTTGVQSLGGGDSPVRLECIANARPLNYLEILWFRKTGSEKTAINDNISKYILTSRNRTLTIKDPLTSDSGLYTCEAHLNIPGSPGLYNPASATLNLTIHLVPRFNTYLPSELRTDFGDRIEIPCDTTGIPTPTITWYKNGKKVADLNEPRYTPQPSGSLVITDAATEDSGMFQCFASNPAGSVDGASWIRVISSPPEITEKPSNLSIVEGNDARFPCKVQGAPKPTVVWTRETSSGLEVIPEEGIVGPSSTVRILDDILLISTSDVEDSGKYTCNATNTKGNAIAFAYLEVSVRTRITQPPQDTSAIMGSTTILSCGVSHDPDVQITMKWFHNSRQLTITDPTSRISMTPEGGLTIRQVRTDDIGVYRCEVTSRGGDDSRQANLQVIELPHPPSITSVKLNSDNAKAVDVSWAPGFDGNSPIQKYIIQYRVKPEDRELGPDDNWQVSNSNINKDLRLYTVTHLLPAKKYQFRISAVNGVGEGPSSMPSQDITLPEQPPSAPPLGVVASASSNSSIIIQWSPPEEVFWNGPLKGYIIRYKLAGYPGSFTEHNITDVILRRYELKELIVFQEYEMQVAAYNRKGTGVFSSSIREWTEEGVPTASPVNVTAFAASSTSITVHWSPPDPQFLNGINQGYKISAQRPNTLNPDVILTVPLDVLNIYGNQSATVEDLRKYTQYDITVLCYTGKGDGPKSASIALTTKEDIPDAVSSLEFTDITFTSVKVSWTPPENINGELVGYTLQWVKKNITATTKRRRRRNVEERILPPGTLSDDITNLQPETVYTISIFASSRVGPGPVRSADIESGVPPEPPGAPTNLGVSNRKARSVLLQFQPGYDGKTSITKWLVEGQVGNDLNWELIYEYSDPDAQKIVVENLRPYTNYLLRMKAQNVAGISPPSEPTSKFQTIQAAPSMPPKNVTVRAVNETAVRVRWTPLPATEWNGAPRGYRIAYKRSDVTTYLSLELEKPSANSYILSKLHQWAVYDVKVEAYNDVGNSGYSPVASDRTRESTPSEGPSNVEATTLSSTSIRVVWGDVPELHRNGLIVGYKVQYGSTEANIAPVLKEITDNNTKTTVLNDLKKYVQYEVQLLAYTRIGDGVLSRPPAVARTFSDKPGPPSSIYFPDVTYTFLKCQWSPPVEPNGVITGYRIAYKEFGSRDDPFVDETLGADRLYYEVNDLQQMTDYEFNLTAKGDGEGWGETATVKVVTMINRNRPDPPSKPTIGQSQVSSREVTISWQPGNDGYGPLRNYTIQVYKEGGEWVTLPDIVPPDVTSYTIYGLKPFTKYNFRLAASNDVGTSDYSPLSDEARTLPDAPDGAPYNLRAVPYTTVSVKVTWELPEDKAWNGDKIGYHVQVREDQSQIQWRMETVLNAQIDTLLLDNMQLKKAYECRIQAFNMYGAGPWSNVILVYMEIEKVYEMRVIAYNSQGAGPPSKPIDVYVGEAVPTEEPKDVSAVPKSSTEISVNWSPPAKETWNGDLLGYKVYYWVENSRETERVHIVSADVSDTILDNLSIFTTYRISVLAFNPAGDGPNSTVAIAKTHEGVPGPPGVLVFSNVSLNSLNVSWSAPERSNGIITQYEILYFQSEASEGTISKTVQVQVNGTITHYLAGDLDENVRYVFSVKGRTSISWGEPRQGNITTGPQPGSPGVPSQPTFVPSDMSVQISWKNGNEGESPITGYIIQAKPTTEIKWTTIMRTNMRESSVIISYRNLNPSTNYQFRVIAINAKGISAPSQPSAIMRTPDFAQLPFYQQWWFLVIVALTGLIFIIIIIAILCISGRNKKNAKYKQEVINKALSMEGMNGVRTDDGGFGTFELRQSRRKPSSNRNSKEIRNSLYAARAPPRPSPASVTYSDAEEDRKSYMEDDESSSLTDKPSDVDSITDSQNSEDSEPESEKPDRSFANHYVNDPVRQSWKRQSSNPNNAYSYTDSEPDNYSVNLNGGHVIMNNSAGSRAPLAGFSSFV